MISIGENGASAPLGLVPLDTTQGVSPGSLRTVACLNELTPELKVVTPSSLTSFIRSLSLWLNILHLPLPPSVSHPGAWNECKLLIIHDQKQCRQEVSLDTCGPAQHPR
jgi:hypothetical protein